MPIYLSATIFKAGNHYNGWLDDIRGIVAQGNSIEEVKEELLQLLQVKSEVENRLRAEKDCSHKNIFHEGLLLQIPA